ncbi:hypothetical protein OR626_20265 [Pseudomonas sp. S1Bt30]|uniref:Peptidase S74 domain-containing protein n=1 Tax=Pseudomonas quebecensis TaxID=2995174 RepID=A0ABY6QAZ7_9PSED|nr:MULTISPECIES: hypothetical protein [Pseudomonas]MCX4066551.1 hypothetical protein [Pseudomonas quebecensis]UZW16954.1 hypothetical protein OSC50_16335 [Pseudomonas quebecensis]UZW25631.1 hypothetical protein OSC48_09145 [Pseudomonas quebecensis]UZW30694.1 hypothetical protein OSC49_09145 [Pseudomonas quebecensis]
MSNWAVALLLSAVPCVVIADPIPEVTAHHVNIVTDDSVDKPSSLRVVKDTHGVSDAVFAYHNAIGPLASGYGFHALDEGDGGAGGGAIGGATTRTTMADAIVGNRRAAGPGNGVIGTRWENGDGSGVYGLMRGTGTGSGVTGYKILTGDGHGVYGKNESTDGSGVYGERLNGAGPGYGVLGYAKGAVGIDNASVAGLKKSGDWGYSILADSRGRDSALRAFSAANAAKAVDSLTDATNNSPVSNAFERANGAMGVVTSDLVSGGGSRNAPLVASESRIEPNAASTGSARVTAIDARVSNAVSGSDDVRGASSTVLATDGKQAIGYRAIVDGRNDANYGVYANAIGGKSNYSGYFVGDVQVGRVMTPTDSKLQEVHGEVDYAKSMQRVLANKIYVSDRYIVWKETDAKGVVTEKRQKITSNETGNLAQDVQKTNPDAVVVNPEGYLSVSDREELYQLKAAVIYLTRQLEAKGINVAPH